MSCSCGGCELYNELQTAKQDNFIIRLNRYWWQRCFVESTVSSIVHFAGVLALRLCLYLLTIYLSVYLFLNGLYLYYTVVY
jgi:hypothetical protein